MKAEELQYDLSQMTFKEIKEFYELFDLENVVFD